MATKANPGTTIYDLDYFTGSQAFIYIGDVWVDEITSFSYELQQRKTPLYGYASQLFDDLAAGQVIVQGQFSINFKEQGYLWAVLRRWHNYQLAANRAFEKEGLLSPQDNALLSGKNGSSPIVWDSTAKNHTNIMRQSIERVVQEKITTGEQYKFYSDLTGYASYDRRLKGTGKDIIFEDIMEEFENQVWMTNKNSDLLDQVRRTDANVFDGFDIFLVLGNYAARSPNHTVVKLVNVSLTGHSKTVVIDGSPIQEVYSFVAQSCV